jgi:hypothetical protein
MYSVRIPPGVTASPFSTAVGCPEEQLKKVRANRIMASLPLIGMGDVLLWILLEIPTFWGFLIIKPRSGVDCLVKNPQLGGA